MKILGWIAFWDDGGPVQDSHGHVIVFKTQDEAMCLGALKMISGISARSLVKSSHRGRKAAKGVES